MTREEIQAKIQECSQAIEAGLQKQAAVEKGIETLKRQIDITRGRMEAFQAVLQDMGEPEPPAPPDEEVGSEAEPGCEDQE